MKIKVLILVLIGLATGQTFAQKADVAGVNWMTGCWEMRNNAKKTVIYEQWSSADGGMLFGIGRTIAEGKVTSWEFMRIEQAGESAKFFAQLPDAASATAFHLKSSTATELVFENLQNDFPHRVIYRSGGKDQLDARIEGTMSGKERAVDFSYQRAGCS
jgi:hypothetical protein